MKKIFVLGLFVVLVSQYGFAQAFIGGGLSFRYSKTTGENYDYSSTSIGISPLLGYSFGSVNVGVLFGYWKSWSLNSSSDYSSSDSEIDFGIFGDLTVLKIDRFSILGRGSFHYVISNYEYTSGSYSSESDSKYIMINLEPMFEYFLFYRLTLYTSIGGISYLHEFGDYAVNRFNISILTGITLGFRFFF